MKEPALGQLLSGSLKQDFFRSRSPKPKNVGESISALLDSTLIGGKDKKGDQEGGGKARTSKELVRGLKDKEPEEPSVVSKHKEEDIEAKVVAAVGEFTGLIDRSKAEMLLFQRTVGHYFNDLDKLDADDKGGFEDLTQEFRLVLDQLLSGDTDSSETRLRIKEFILDLLKEVETYIVQFKRLTKLLRAEAEGYFHRAKDISTELEMQIVNELSNTLYHNEKLSERVGRLEKENQHLVDRENWKTKQYNALKAENMNLKWAIEELNQKLEVAESRLSFAEGMPIL